VIERSASRLQEAVSRLEVAVDRMFEQTGDPALARQELAAMIADRSRLAEELDEALAREKELQALADEASEALGAAISEVQAALGRQGTS